MSYCSVGSPENPTCLSIEPYLFLSFAFTAKTCLRQYFLMSHFNQVADRYDAYAHVQQSILKVGAAFYTFS